MLRGQDVRLPTIVDEVCRAAGVHLVDVDRFAVVTGPGSFTGVRVGVSFARGLALATGKPCVGVSSLEASLPAGQQGSALVLLPAQKRPPDITYWAQTFRSGAATNAPCEMRLEHILQTLSERPHQLYGSADALLEAAPHLKLVPQEPDAMRAAQVTQTLEPDLHPPIPTYARAPDAALPGGKTRP